MIQTLQIAGGLAASVIAIAGAVRLLRPFRVAFHRTSQFLDDWQGQPERPGVPARAGVMERLDKLERVQAGINHQVHSNGGDSLRDGVPAIKEAVTGQPLPPAPPAEQGHA